MIYATTADDAGDRIVRLISSDRVIGIIILEHGEHVFYAQHNVALTVDLLVCITNFLRTLNV